MPFLQDDPVILTDHSRTFGLQKLMIVDHILCRPSGLHNNVFCRTESFTLLQDELSCAVEIYV